MYIYIYIYIERERETYTNTYIYIYTHIYIYHIFFAGMSFAGRLVDGDVFCPEFTKGGLVKLGSAIIIIIII